MTRVEVTATTYVRVIDVVDGREVFSVSIDVGGVRGCSGRLLGERPSGERCDVDALRFLAELYELGRAAGEAASK